jgi:hypothetical protein
MVCPSSGKALEEEVIQHVSEDGEVGIAWVCSEHRGDPSPNPRVLGNGYFSQWFTPFLEKSRKK